MCTATQPVKASHLPPADQREAELWAARARDPNDGGAVGELLEYFLPLVQKVVKHISIRIHWRVEPRELLGAGVLGLHEAIERYCPDRGVHFTDYAKARIRGAVLDELRSRDHLTSRQRRAVKRLHGVLETFTQEHQRPPSDQELSAEAGMGVGDVEFLLGLGAGTVSLEDEVDDGLHYSDVIADDHGVAPDIEAERRLSLEAMREAITQLAPRDQQLLFFRHHEQLSVKEIGAVFGVTPGRVSQLYNAVVLKLRILLEVRVRI